MTENTQRKFGFNFITKSKRNFRENYFFFTKRYVEKLLINFVMCLACVCVFFFFVSVDIRVESDLENCPAN